MCCYMKQPTTLVLSPEVRSGLDLLAASIARSRSWTADGLIREGLATRGALPPTPEPTPSSRERAAA